MNKVFPEQEGNYQDPRLPPNPPYEKKSSGGKTNYFQYENGLLTKIQINGTWMDFDLILDSKS